MIGVASVVTSALMSHPKNVTREGPRMDKLLIATLLLRPHASVIVLLFFSGVNDRKRLMSVDRKAVNCVVLSDGRECLL